MSDMTQLWLMCAVVVIAATGACTGSSGRDNRLSAAKGSPVPTRYIHESCAYRENGFRSGVNPPREIKRIEPDLAGLPLLPPEPIFIVEVRIDATGRVTEDCMLRGVTEEADRRVLDAVRGWMFEPPRLLAAVESPRGRWEAGHAVPIFMTVTVRPGRTH
jgi:hypothetical protein